MHLLQACVVLINCSSCISHPRTYPKFVAEGVLVNILGLILVTLAALVTYVMTNPAYKRKHSNDAENIELIPGNNKK